MENQAIANAPAVGVPVPLALENIKAFRIFKTHSPAWYRGNDLGSIKFTFKGLYSVALGNTHYKVLLREIELNKKFKNNRIIEKGQMLFGGQIFGSRPFGFNIDTKTSFVYLAQEGGSKYLTQGNANFIFFYKKLYELWEPIFLSLQENESILYENGLLKKLTLDQNLAPILAPIDDELKGLIKTVCETILKETVDLFKSDSMVKHIIEKDEVTPFSSLYSLGWKIKEKVRNLWQNLNFKVGAISLSAAGAFWLYTKYKNH